MRTDSHSEPDADKRPDSEYARHARALRDAEAAGDSTAHAALVAELAHRQAVHRAVEALRRQHTADADFISDCD
jgi:hypothetical protein